MKLMISIGVLLCVAVAPPPPLALCNQDADSPDSHFEIHDLVAGTIWEGECNDVTEISGKVTRVERDKTHDMVTVFKVRSNAGKDWTFDAVGMKQNMRVAVRDEFDNAIAVGDRIELAIYLCGEKFDRIRIDAIDLRRPD